MSDSPKDDPEIDNRTVADTCRRGNLVKVRGEDCETLQCFDLDWKTQPMGVSDQLLIFRSRD